MDLRSSAIALILALGIQQQIASADSHRTVVLSGQPASGAPDGMMFSKFRQAVINDAGDVAFHATLGSSSGSNDAGSAGIWAVSGNNLRKVVLSGEAAEGFSPGYVYGQLWTQVIDEQGNVAFESSVAKPNSAGSIASVPYSEGFGALRRVAEGPFAWTTMAISEGGKVALKSMSLEAGVGEVAYTDVSGVVTRLLGQGDPAPGYPGYLVKVIDAPVINNSGLIVMAAIIEEPSQAKLAGLIYKLDGGALSPLIELGKTYPGLGLGVSFSGVGTATINNAGQVLFFGRTNEGTTGAFRYSEGTVSEVMRLNSKPTNPTPGPRFAYVDNLRINGVGDATFTATTVGYGADRRTNSSLWTQRDGNLVMVAERFSQVPGFAAGVNFVSALGGDYSSSLAVNANGQLAFEAVIGGPTIRYQHSGIWATDLSGVLRVVVRTGESIDVNDDPLLTDFRTISAATIALFGGGGEDGRGTSFNDAGELAVMLAFTDGSSGIFVFNTAVPEPSSWFIIGVAAVAISLIRNGRGRQAARPRHQWL